MEKKHYSIINFLLLPGLLLSILILFLITTIFVFLFSTNSKLQINQINYLFEFYYLIKVLKFSFFQAILSTILVIFISFFIALALNRRNFIAKNLLISLCNVILILPVLVVIIGMINIYGQEGWLSKLCKFFNVNYNFSIYGLSGIIITHIFFNVPFTVSIFLKQLKLIPIEKIYISESLQITGWDYFCLIEWPYLKAKIKSTIIIVFILCFSSLTTILTLGGGPKNTNLEVAIFHALSYDYNTVVAAILSILKMFFCLFLFFIIKGYKSKFYFCEYSNSKKRIVDFKQKNKKVVIFIDVIAITFFVLIIIPPILTLIFDGFNQNIKYLVKDYIFWKAIINSLSISIISGIFSLIISITLILSMREYVFKNYSKLSYLIEFISILIFSMPSITFATGLFLIFNKYVQSYQEIYYLIIITNTFTNIPFIIKILKSNFFNIGLKYNNLCNSLNIKGWQRFKLIECKALKKPISQALSVSFILSIGDVNIISLFGNQDFYTITFYLYQQISSYKDKQAIITALFLLILCLLIFKIVEKISKKI